MKQTNWQVLKSIHQAIDSIIDMQAAESSEGKPFFANDRYRETLRKLREDERIVAENT